MTTEVRPISVQVVIGVGAGLWIGWILLGVVIDKLSKLPRLLLRRR